MKRTHVAAAMMLLAVSLWSCKKETVSAGTENNNLPQNVQKAPVEDVQNASILRVPIKPPMGANNWEIGSFKMKGKNLTNHYRGYYFQFQENNLLVATTPSVRMYGSWNMPGDETLTISFGKGELSDLDDNWTILQKTDKTIYLTIPNTLKSLRLDAVSVGVVLR